MQGFDIDSRASQIAALALWLRVQRAYKELSLSRPPERPAILRSNIVTAEPMPGRTDRVEADFSASLRPRVLGDLVRVVWEKMQLAGEEAGSLLRIDAELASAISAARSQWQRQPKAEQLAIFGNSQPRPSSCPIDVSGISDSRFWEQAEGRVIAALSDYTERATAETATARRLFADDALEGFAFIELCRKSYDVVLMNPPFGLAPRPVYEYLTTGGISHRLLRPGYCVHGAGPRSRSWRADRSHHLTGIPHGCGRPGIPAGYRHPQDRAARRPGHRRHGRGPRRRLRPGPRQRPAIHLLDRRPQEARQPRGAPRVGPSLGGEPEIEGTVLDRFLGAAGPRIAYDQASDAATLLAAEGQGLDPVDAIARTGGSTFEDERFLRLRWEPSPESVGLDATWAPLGRNVPEFSPYYYPSEVVVKWNRDGRELQARNEIVNGQNTVQARQGSSTTDGLA